MVFSIYLPFFFAAYKCVNLQKIKKKIVTKSLNLLQSNNKLMKRHTLSSLFFVSKNKHMMAAKFDISEVCSAEQVLTKNPYYQ